MSEPTQNRPSTSAPMGLSSSSHTSSSPSQIPDLEVMRQGWDEKLEADFAEIKEILRECRERDALAKQQSANDTHKK